MLFVDRELRGCGPVVASDRRVSTRDVRVRTNHRGVNSRTRNGHGRRSVGVGDIEPGVLASSERSRPAGLADVRALQAGAHASAAFMVDVGQ